VYHIELRHFPHSAWRFNLTEQEMLAIAEPWAREQIVDVGERKWSPHLAKLTILDGPHLDIAQLSMGRGWSAAQHDSDDVTEQVLARAREGERVEQAALSVSGPVGAPGAGASGGGLSGDPIALGVQLATLLGADAIALLDAWREAAAASPALAPSESLALAEQSLTSGARDQADGKR
jgi:hypothetical protein